MKRGASPRRSRRAAAAPKPAPRVAAPSALIPLTRRVLAELQSADEVHLPTLQRRYGLKTRRSLYVVLGVLDGIGCTRHIAKGRWQWVGGAELLERAIDEARARFNSSMTTGGWTRMLTTMRAAELALQYLSVSAARTHNVSQMARALDWDDRRLLYDVINVFHGVQLVVRDDNASAHKTGSFRWTPGRAFSEPMPSTAHRVTLRLSAENVQHVWDSIKI